MENEKGNIEVSKIRTFKDLYAWQAGHELILRIYAVTREFPKEELYGLTSQSRRCAVSITSNIAEGFGRRTMKDKIQFYTIARGSAIELQNQLLIACDISYLSKPIFEELEEKCLRVQKLLNGLIELIASFRKCHSERSEESSNY